MTVMVSVQSDRNDLGSPDQRSCSTAVHQLYMGRSFNEQRMGVDLPRDLPSFLPPESWPPSYKFTNCLDNEEFRDVL